MKFYTVDEISLACGIARKTLIYHHERRGLAEPGRVGTRRFYSLEDFDRIKVYFEAHKRYERAKVAQ